MTVSPWQPDPPIFRGMKDVRELLERARRAGNHREIEAAFEWINAALDER